MAPRTPPGGIRVSEYQDAYPPDGSWVNKLLLATTTGLSGALCGTLLALYVARDNRGVTQEKMQEYVSTYDAAEKRASSEHTTHQDEGIGELRGKQEKLFSSFNDMQFTIKEHDRDLTEIKGKLKLAADYMEEQSKVKR